MRFVYLTEADVERLLDMRLTMNIVREAFVRLASGEADNVPRTRAIGTGIALHSMSAAASYLGLVGWKQYTTTREGAKFVVGLHDAEGGELAALIEADHLGQMRTGAVTGLAIELLCPAETSELGLFGTGRQATTQLLAACTARPIAKAFVYSRNEGRREQFAEAMSQRMGIDVVAVDRPQEAAEDLPLVITATDSREPVFDGLWLAEGTLLCAVGVNWLNRAEIDSTAVRRADNVVCDSVECCRREAGDFVDALEKGVFDWRRAVDLADVVAGKHVGRSTPDSLVLFKSVGMALTDVAVGGRLLACAREQGLGTTIET